MRYLGGKERLARHLAEVMLAGPARPYYWEPFVGGASVLKRMAPHFERAYASDVVPDLIELYRAVQRGVSLPTTITEAEYRALRNAEPSAVCALAGFGGSFGGKWFGGYARGNGPKGPRNYVAETVRNLEAMREAISHVEFRCLPYEKATASAQMLVYCDPPYAGTTGYDGTDGFDHGAFWGWARQQARRGAMVYVSEYTAPPWAQQVWEKPVKSTVARAKVDNARTEKLFRVLG